MRCAPNRARGLSACLHSERTAAVDGRPHIAHPGSMRPRLLLVLSLWSMLVGCSGDDSSGDGSENDAGVGAVDADVSADLEAVCQGSCDHAVDCEWLADADGCADDCAGSLEMFRLDAVLLQWACLGEVACETDNPGETCFVEIIPQLDAHAVHDQYHADCTAADAECGGLPGDVCAVVEVIMFNDTYMENEVMPCLDLECDALRACLEEKVLDAF